MINLIRAHHALFVSRPLHQQTSTCPNNHHSHTTSVGYSHSPSTLLISAVFESHWLMPVQKSTTHHYASCYWEWWATNEWRLNLIHSKTSIHKQTLIPKQTLNIFLYTCRVKNKIIKLWGCSEKKENKNWKQK